MTRLITLVMSLAPVKVALSPVLTLKLEKEWKRLVPARLPSTSPMVKSGPVSAWTAPTVPSVAIWASDPLANMSQHPVSPAVATKRR